MSEKKPSSLSIRQGTIGQVFRMLKHTRRWWMVPMLLVLVLVGLALGGLQAMHYLAPFSYAVI